MNLKSRNKIIGLIIGIFIFGNALQAQKSLLLLDGSFIKSSQIKYNDSLNIYNYLNKRNKIKSVDRDFVYSISDLEGNEQIIYQPDKLSQEISIKEMRSFIKGEQFVHSNYKPYGAALGGLVVGLGSSLGFPYLKLNPFFSTFVPLTYLSGQIFIKHNVKIMGAKEDSAYPDYYIKGFRDKAVRKRFIFTIIASFIGTSIGLTIDAYKLTN